MKHNLTTKINIDKDSATTKIKIQFIDIKDPLEQEMVNDKEFMKSIMGDESILIIDNSRNVGDNLQMNTDITSQLTDANRSNLQNVMSNQSRLMLNMDSMFANEPKLLR